MSPRPWSPSTTVQPPSAAEGTHARSGRLPPLAWDRIDADEAPAELPTTVDFDDIAVDLAVMGERPHLNNFERPAPSSILNRDRHMTDWAISAHLGIHKDSIQRYRREASIPAAVNSAHEVVNA